MEIFTDVSQVKLEFVKPWKEIGGMDEIELRDDVINPYLVEKFKERALVGYVLGDDPLPSSMQKFIDNNWSQYGRARLYSLESGIFIFKFDTSGWKQKILDEGPWFFEVRPLILKLWTPKVKLCKEDVKSVALWFTFPNLNVHLWSARLVSKIASVLGNPLFADRVTATSERHSSSRICVEVNGNTVPPIAVLIQDKNGKFDRQEILCEWKPCYCSSCKKFLHSSISDHRH